VERTTERLAGRGRPRYLFAATKASLARLFTGNQWLLVPAMWEAIVDIGGKSLKRKVLKRVSRAMADHYRSRINGNTPGERLTEMAELLRDEGGLIDIEGDGNGQVVFHKRSCPFISMFEKTRTVCQVDLEVMTLVVGIRVRRTASRHDGAPCCSFAIKSSKGK
jgi:predicted ArsR family transcriptional regulator